MTSGVYLIRCKATDRVYVGSSCNIEGRWTQHRSLLNNGKHHSVKLQRAWDKYGAEAFEFYVIEQNCLDLIQSEQRWIDNYDAFKTGFNSRALADRPELQGDVAKTDWLRTRLTPEQKQKLESHAIARKTSVTAIVEELINALPDSTEGIPVARIIYEVKK